MTQTSSVKEEEINRLVKSLNWYQERYKPNLKIEKLEQEIRLLKQQISQTRASTLKEVRELINKRMRELGVGIQNYTEDLETENDLEEVNRIRWIIQLGESKLHELTQICKRIDEL